MSTPHSAIQDFTTSIRTPRGRLMVRIDKSALLRLGATDDEHSLLATLDRHMPRFHALAVERAAGGARYVSLSATDVTWPAEGPQDRSGVGGASDPAPLP